tara:strand:+ start:63471 stop:63644 length:174 start_codon:yes stop_codon:yes gene_type:complete
MSQPRLAAIKMVFDFKFAPHTSTNFLPMYNPSPYVFMEPLVENIIDKLPNSIAQQPV